MNPIKIFLTASISIFLISCTSPSNDNSAPAKWDQAKLDFVSQSQCPTGRKLAEDLDATLKNNFDDLGGPVGNVIGFFSGNGSCALDHSINDNMAFGWFEVKISNCLKNGSIWTRQSFTEGDNIYRYVYQRADVIDGETISIGATGGVPVSYGRDHAGLRLLSCE